jgi:hypothetical protein
METPARTGVSPSRALAQLRYKYETLACVYVCIHVYYIYMHACVCMYIYIYIYIYIYRQSREEKEPRGAFPLFRRDAIYARTADTRSSRARPASVLIDTEGFNYNIGAARAGIYGRRGVTWISKVY